MKLVSTLIDDLRQALETIENLGEDALDQLKALLDKHQQDHADAVIVPADTTVVTAAGDQTTAGDAAADIAAQGQVPADQSADAGTIDASTQDASGGDVDGSDAGQDPLDVPSSPAASDSAAVQTPDATSASSADSAAAQTPDATSSSAPAADSTAAAGTPAQ